MSKTMIAALVMLAMLVGCAPAWKHIDRAALVVSTAALTCDWAQTRTAAASGWRGTAEVNPIMGAAPGTRTVDVYFASTAVINAALWYVLPAAWRSIVPTAVVGVQAETIVGNVPTTHTVCGVR